MTAKLLLDKPVSNALYLVVFHSFEDVPQTVLLRKLNSFKFNNIYIPTITRMYIAYKSRLTALEDANMIS